jgi:endonuclease VIII
VRITRLRGAPARACLPCGRVEGVEALRKHLLIRIAGTEGRRQALRDRLGPDLLAEDTDVTSLPARARGVLPVDAPLTDVLLDQRVAAGIGNEYKSEPLFLAGLSPHRALGSVDDETLVSIFALACDLLLRNLGYRPPTTRFAGDGLGRVRVYGRRGKPCLRCGVRVRYARLGCDQRGTYWCPACQPDPSPDRSA